MSERTRRGALALVLGVLAAPPAGAQDLDSLRVKLDSIAAEYRNAVAVSRAEQESARSRAAAALAEPLDTAAVGPFRIVARPRELATAVRHFRAAWTRAQPMLGEQALLVPGRTFLVSVSSPVPVFRAMRDPEVRLRRWRFGAVRAAAADAAIAGVVVELVPKSVQEWSGAGVFQEPRWPQVYRELATSAAIPARRCLEGDVAACLIALQLEPVRAGADSWYSPAHLRELALEQAGFRSSPDRAACRGGSTPACLRLLPPGWIPPPLSTWSRAGFAQLALELGGDRALARLASDTSGTVAEHLQAAAGIPLEQLARDWRARVVSARPDVYAGAGVTLAATIFWSLLFVCLAARSTRCRTG